MQERRVRIIDLNTIKSRLLILKNAQPDATKALLSQLSSEVESLDNRVRAIFKDSKADLISHPNAMRQSPLSIEANFKEKYNDLAQELNTLGCALIEGIKANFDISEQIIKELKGIGEDLVKLSHAVPTFRYGRSKRTLYALSEALGGLNIRLGQDMLPTGGLEEVTVSVMKNNGELESTSEIKDVDGNCAGMVSEWVRQSVVDGTPKYPIGTEISVIRQQAAQKAILFSDYVHDEVSQHLLSFDIEKKLTELVENVPFQISLFEKGRGGHAIGIRKHPNYVEIFEPNFGYFFFEDIKSASIWLSLLLQVYYSSDFPCEQITFSMYGCLDAAEIPHSIYPTNEEIKSGVLTPYTPEGYDILTTHYKRHLSQVIKSAKEEKVIAVTVQAFLSISQRLSIDDTQILIRVVTSLIDQHEIIQSEDRDRFFQSSSVYQKLKSCAKDDQAKEALSSVLMILRRTTDSHSFIQEESLAIIKEVEKTIEECRRKINNNMTDIAEEKRKDNPDSAHIASLQNHTDILIAKQRNLQKANIIPKLKAAYFKKIDYTPDDARADINAELGESLDIAALSQHLNLLDTINQLRNGFELSRNHLQEQLNTILENKLHKGIYVPITQNFGDYTFDQIYQINRIKEKMVMVDQHLSELNAIKETVIKNENIASTTIELRRRFNTLLNKQNNFLEWIDDFYLSALPKPYPPEYLQQLKLLTELISSHTQPSLLSTITVIADHHDTHPAMKLVAHEISGRALHLRSAVIQALHPFSKYRPDMTDLYGELHAFLPFLPTIHLDQLAHYIYFLANFANRVATLTDLHQSHGFANYYRLQQRQYQSNDISMLRLVTNLANELKIDLSQNYLSLTDHYLRERIDSIQASARIELDHPVDQSPVIDPSSDHAADSPTNPFSVLSDEKNKFCFDLAIQITKIEKSSYGKNELNNAKVAVLTQLRNEIAKSGTESISSVVERHMKMPHRQYQTNGDLIKTQRRTGLLSIFNPAKTSTQKLLEDYLSPKQKDHTCCLNRANR